MKKWKKSTYKLLKTTKLANEKQSIINNINFYINNDIKKYIFNHIDKLIGFDIKNQNNNMVSPTQLVHQHMHSSKHFHSVNTNKNNSKHIDAFKH